MRILFFLVFLYLVFCTSFTWWMDNPYNFKRLIQGALLMGAAGIVFISGNLQKEWYRHIKLIRSYHPLIFWASVCLALTGIISSILSAYPIWAFQELVHNLLLLNLLFLAMFTYQKYPDLFEKYLLVTFGLMAGIYLLNVTVSYTYTFFIPGYPLWPDTYLPNIWFRDTGWLYPRPFSNFVNFRFFNQVQTWTLPLVTLLVLRIPKRQQAFRILTFMILCGWWMLIFASDARGTMVASAAALAFIAIWFGSKALAWIKIHCYSAMAGLAGYFIFFKAVQSGSVQSFSDYSSSGRLELWEYALQLIWANPFFGVGPMHYAQYNEIVRHSGPHNVYLQLFSEWGIFFGILLIAIISAGFLMWYKSSRKIIAAEGPDSDRGNIRIALTASVVAAGVHAFFTNMFYTPISQTVMVLIIAWMIGISLPRSMEGEVDVNPGVWKRFGIAGSLFMATVFMTSVYTIQVPELEQQRRNFIKITERDKLQPRYWDQGIFGYESTAQGSINIITTGE